MACGHISTVTCPECDKWRTWNPVPVKWVIADPWKWWEPSQFSNERLMEVVLLKQAMWDALQTLSCDKGDYDASASTEDFVAAFKASVDEFSRDFDDLIDQVIVLTAKNRELQKIVDNEKKNAG